MNKEIDSLKGLIDEKSKEIDSLSKVLDALYTKYREIMVRLKELKVSRQRGIQLKVLEERRKEIEEKARRGEPLSIDEMRILYGEFDVP